jgi:hypothetical protein
MKFLSDFNFAGIYYLGMASLKIAKSLKIFSRTISATGEQKNISVIDIFPIMLLRVQRYEKSQFQCLITSRNEPIFDLSPIFQGLTNVTMLILDLKCLLLSRFSDYEAHFLHE